jgi:DNA helicase-2/ATP-dependent DNA helicase PcrA
MNPELILDGLNDAQRSAVTAPPGAALVLAGAGSGKTRVLTRRIAWVIATEGVAPEEILAVTFTNKAAAEMRARVERILERPAANLWIGTFHGLAHRMLRRHHEAAHLPAGFQILDGGDQQRLIKRLLKTLALDDKEWPPRMIAGIINRTKDEGQRLSEVQSGNDARERTLASILAAYDEACARAGLVDFAELLLSAARLLSDNPGIAARYHARFRHILVDEFQDTNTVQYLWVRALAGRDIKPFIVGDDDQCLAAGTPITMADGSCKSIERVRPGDSVLSAYGSGSFRPARVFERKALRPRRNLVELQTRKGRKLASTAEHMHFAGYLLGETPQLYFSYLMFKANIGYRLGTSQVYTQGQARPMLGFKQRCLQEHADALWIIGTHQSENEARMEETLLSLSYGLPMVPFVARKGGSTNGLIHDKRWIERLFRAIDTESAALRLLKDCDLHPDEPHHRPQSRNSNRRNIVITLCGDRRGATPMHRLSVIGNDEAGRAILSKLGFRPRAAKSGSSSWRYETCRKDFGELMRIAEQIRSALDGSFSFHANLCGRSLPFTRAASIRPGMAMVDADGEIDIVSSVRRLDGSIRVYDLDIEWTHNFVAGGIVTHNSIYGWRGAQVENLGRFQHDYAPVRVVRLEQNYRSSGHILAAANAVIAKNNERMGKTLWTAGSEGAPIALYAASDERDEAAHIVARIERWIAEGGSAGDAAILYRSNAQSRMFEETLIARGLPYRVYGGLRFFERAEIKDALAYLRLAARREDDAALERIVNVPARGIGQRTLDAVRAHARHERIPLWQAAAALARGEGELAARARTALASFIRLIEQMSMRIEGRELGEAMEYVIAASGLAKHHGAEGGEIAEARVENLAELVNAASDFTPDPDLEPLEAFLAQAALEAGDTQAGDWANAVKLMTLHSAKGLEFPLVAIAGLEEGLFPHMKSVETPKGLEEERRLFYVGMTRAREELLLAHAERRHLHGQIRYSKPSRFLAELPEANVEETGPRRSARYSAAPAHGGGELGRRVRHAAFGEGVVLAQEGDGARMRIKVAFADAGIKWLMAEYARLEPMS